MIRFKCEKCGKVLNLEEHIFYKAYVTSTLCLSCRSGKDNDIPEDTSMKVKDLVAMLLKEDQESNVILARLYGVEDDDVLDEVFEVCHVEQVDRMLDGIVTTATVIYFSE